MGHYFLFYKQDNLNALDLVGCYHWKILRVAKTIVSLAVIPTTASTITKTGFLTKVSFLVVSFVFVRIND